MDTDNAELKVINKFEPGIEDHLEKLSPVCSIYMFPSFGCTRMIWMGN